MGTKHFIELNTDYDIELLVSSAKKSLKKSLLMLGLYSFIFAISVLVVIFWGSYIPVFVIGIIAAKVFPSISTASKDISDGFIKSPSR